MPQIVTIILVFFVISPYILNMEVDFFKPARNAGQIKKDFRMIIIKQTINKNRSFIVRCARGFSARTLMWLCDVIHIKYQVKKRVRC